ncbi:hypothetical protein [Spongiactinospora sp. 9N601]|uniref:hypothetical protein n=1 Tax=Spongiactinospora sp. 9N601 TaxID=3375149 RepID=UPI00378D1099
MRAAIDQIAARIGTPADIEDPDGGHYSTSIHFGPVEYKALAIFADARARYAAETRYSGCVRPDHTTSERR